MAAIKVKCPHCNATRNAPETADGKIVSCPACGEKFQVKACAEMEQVDDEPGPAVSARPVESRPSRRARGERKDDDRQKPSKRIPFWVWIAGGGALALAALVGCAGVIVVAVVAANRSPQAPKLRVEADPSVTDLTFGEWRVVEGVNGLGQPGTWAKTTATAGSHKVGGIFSYNAALYDAKGVKLEDGLLLMPDLAPGERGEVQIPLRDGTVRVVISRRQGL